MSRNPNDYLCLSWTEHHLWLFFYFGIALGCDGPILEHLFYTSFATLCLRAGTLDRELLALLQELIIDQLQYWIGPSLNNIQLLATYWITERTCFSIQPPLGHITSFISLKFKYQSLSIWTFHILIENQKLFYISSERLELTKFTNSTHLLLLLDEIVTKVAALHLKHTNR